MGSRSVTGVSGPGVTGQYTTKELSSLANAPTIIFSGTIEGVSSFTSPPSSGNNLTFIYPLPGGAASYIVILTTLNGGKAFISSMDEDGSGNFTGFSFACEADCTVMYLVTKIGTRPQIVV